jgi:hypothetical protein
VNSAEDSGTFVEEKPAFFKKAVVASESAMPLSSCEKSFWGAKVPRKNK